MATSTKKTPLTVERLTAVLNEVARNHQTDLVVFTTSGSGDIIRARDKIDVYIRNNGNMGWLDLGHFALETEEIIGRRAEFHSMPPRTSKKNICALNGIEAYRLVSGDRPPFAVANPGLVNKDRSHPGADYPSFIGMVPGQSLYLT